jgi:hypothetical protein
MSETALVSRAEAATYTAEHGEKSGKEHVWATSFTSIHHVCQSVRIPLCSPSPALGIVVVCSGANQACS